MRRFLLLSALFLLLATGAGHALAKAQYANCPGFCFAWTAWNGTIYGVAGNFEPTGAAPRRMMLERGAHSNWA